MNDRTAIHHHHLPPSKPSAAASAFRWRRKASVLLRSAPLLLLLLLGISFLRSPIPSSSSFSSIRPLDPGKGCGNGGWGAEERFLWYAPHSGFSNQLSELRNALLFAGILNRTLVVPPVLDHHAVALGSCPKFRVTEPRELLSKVWDHTMELLRTGRYVSMSDIVDLSPLLSSQMARVIDFRLFILKWCGLNMQHPCSIEKSPPEKLNQCRSLLSGLEGNARNCIHAVEDDCRTTVWTYKKNDDDVLDIFQPDEELRRKKRISYVRKRRDIYRAFGPGTIAETAVVLSFGTLFTSPYKDSELYIDIHEVTAEPRIQSLLQKIEFLPFVPEIVKSGKEYAKKNIREPYLCAQLRLLDGQFKNHWKATFDALRQRLDSLRLERKQSNTDGPIHIFIMTDLPSSNWTGTYLAELARDSNSFKMHSLKDNDPLVLNTAKSVLDAQHGIRASFVTKDNDLERRLQTCNSELPDILLFLEETVCSCAALGFVATAGSTIADSIELMRKNEFCVM